MAKRHPWFIRAAFRIHRGELSWARFDAIVARGQAVEEGNRG